MQDEIRKHSKNAINKMKTEEHSITEKIKEISVEIFIIVFAVSFSIWLHGWSEHRHQQEEVKELLSDLKDDIKNDILSMEAIKKSYSNTVESFTYLINLNESQYDSLSSGKDSVTFKENLSTKIHSVPSGWRKTNCGNYEGFKSSGKIGFIENKKLKKLILEYYEQLNPMTSIQDEYSRKEVEKFGDLIFGMTGQEGREIIFNPKIKLHLSLMIMMSNSSIENYDETILAAKTMIAEIDKDLHE